MRRRALGNIQELYNSCKSNNLPINEIVQLINLGFWETVHPPTTSSQVSMSHGYNSSERKKNRSYTVLIKTNKH